MFEAICGFLIKYRKSTLVIMALITAFFGAQIFRIEMFTQFLDLFPYNHPYVEVHKAVCEVLRGRLPGDPHAGGQERRRLQPRNPDQDAAIQDAVDLIPGVDHFGIYSVASPKVAITKEETFRLPTKQLMEEPPTRPGRDRRAQEKGLYQRGQRDLVSRDQKALLLDANFIEGIIDFNDLFDKFMAIKKKEEDANHNIYLSGTPLLYGWIYHYLPNMALILVITSVIILLMLYAYMSQGGLWWWPFIGAVLCSIWGLGFSACLGFHFDPLIIVIPFLLSARAMSHGVQWVERFVEEYRRTDNIKEAAIITGTSLFPPGLIGIVADTWALLIIAITPSPPCGTSPSWGPSGPPPASSPSLSFSLRSSPTSRMSRSPGSRCPDDHDYRIEYFTEHVLRRILIRMSALDLREGEIDHGGHQRHRPHRRHCLLL